MNASPLNPQSDRHRVDDFPALAGLRLTDADLAALARQGFVSRERRGDREYFKLRFRRDHHQVVKYLGAAEHAAAVQADLARLQADFQLRRKLAVLSRQARGMLRDAKHQLEPSLIEQGFHFHGLAIRQSRRQQVPVS